MSVSNATNNAQQINTHENIDWLKIQGTSAWRDKLYTVTKEVLKSAAAESLSLSSLNSVGIYHNVKPIYGVPLMKE
jgi:hypothetical protein